VLLLPAGIAAAALAACYCSASMNCQRLILVLLLLLLPLLLQGTYEVNVLVAGRGATGISAIKAASKANQRGVQQVQA
jgi:hypothetical protein